MNVSDADIGKDNTPEIENLSHTPQEQNISTKNLLDDNKILSSEDNESSAIGDNKENEIEKENCNLEVSSSGNQENDLNSLMTDVAKNAALNDKEAININDDNSDSQTKKSEDHQVSASKFLEENILAFDFEIG